MIWLLQVIAHSRVIGQKYFMASFQTDLKISSAPSENVWIEFLDEIRPSTEFTICHWINIKFYNIGIAACLWSYCTVERQGIQMECLQLCLRDIHSTTNRNLKLAAD